MEFRLIDLARTFTCALKRPRSLGGFVRGTTRENIENDHCSI